MRSMIPGPRSAGACVRGPISPSTVLRSVRSIGRHSQHGPTCASTRSPASGAGSLQVVVAGQREPREFTPQQFTGV